MMASLKLTQIQGAEIHKNFKLDASQFFGSTNQAEKERVTRFHSISLHQKIFRKRNKKSNQLQTFVDFGNDQKFSFNRRNHLVKMAVIDQVKKFIVCFNVMVFMISTLVLACIETFFFFYCGANTILESWKHMLNGICSIAFVLITPS